MIYKTTSTCRKADLSFNADATMKVFNLLMKQTMVDENVLTLKLLQHHSVVLKARIFLFIDLRGAYPKILSSPSRKIELLFWVFIFFICRPSIFWVKNNKFTCIFGEIFLLFDRPKLFYLFIFISSPRLIKFQTFPVNQQIKHADLSCDINHVDFLNRILFV